MASWQPIETCPPATPVLAYIPDVREKDRIQVGWWNMSGNKHPIWVFGGGARFGFDVGEATHWMPLPAPPSTLTDEAKLRRSQALDELGALDGEELA